jgi:uncharacterized membrane protein
MNEESNQSQGQTPNLNLNNSTPPKESANSANQSEKSEDTALDLQSVTDLTNEEKIWGAVSYLSFLCILPLLTKKNSLYCQFHAKQGLVLAILFTLVKFFWVIRMFIPFLGLLEIIIVVSAAIQAYVGRWWKIPGVYGWSKKITL